jgi:hypothetical protein
VRTLQASARRRYLTIYLTVSLLSAHAGRPAGVAPTLKQTNTSTPRGDQSHSQMKELGAADVWGLNRFFLKVTSGNRILFALIERLVLFC